MGGRKGGKMWHKSVQAPKAPDRLRDNYEGQKKRYSDAKDKGLVKSKVRTEVRSVKEIGKNRKEKEKRKEKNNRPTKKRKM